MSKPDPHNSQFTEEFFLLGTHFDEDSPSFGKDQVRLLSVRVPIYEKGEAAKKSVIDYTKLSKDWSQSRVVRSWDHDGEVNRVRAHTSNPDIIASLTNSGKVSIYDQKSDSSKPTSQLSGLTQDGFGICWHPKDCNQLSAATGETVALWDVNKPQTPLILMSKAHTAVINDIKFNPVNPALFITASDDGHFKVWDVRKCQQGDQQSSSFVQTYKASDEELLCASFNCFDEHLFATGGENSGIINIWDMRMPKTFLNDLNFHQGKVMQIEWSPHQEMLFMSGSQDGKVYVWDQSKCGEEQARHDYEDGPPEMIFPHTAHNSAIEDICWSTEKELFAVSVDTDMQMMVWKMQELFLEDDQIHLDKLDKIDESKLS